MALPLFDTSVAPAAPRAARPRRQFAAVTSRKAYDELKPKMLAREAFVIGGLLDFAREKPQRHPTAYELIEFLKAKHPAARIDANTVRPRLTEMAKTFYEPHWTPVEHRTPKRALVAKVEKRTCTVTKRTAWTWRVL